MKRRAIAAVAVMIFAAAMSAVAIGTASLATAATGDLSGTGQKAFAEIANCSANATVLLASIVVDESGSLRQTDPADKRVAGITTAIDTLADLRAATTGKLDVQASLSTFATGYEQLVPWGSLDKAHADQLRTTAAVELPKRNQGEWTDYAQALRGAQQQLDDQARKVQGTACKVVLWFTDGGLDVGKSTDTVRRELCSPQGLVDGLRGDGVNVLAFALFTTTGSGSVTALQREQLRAIVEGTGGGASCGAIPFASGSSSGAYLRADDAGSLRRLFAGAGALISGGNQAVAVNCPSNGCINGELPFPVDAGIAGARLVVDSGAGLVPLNLVDPQGNRHVLVSGTTAVPGGTVQVSARNGLTVASLSFSSLSGPQVGAWSLLAQNPNRQPAPVTVDLYYLWGAQLAVSAPKRLVLGENSTLNVTLTGSGGTRPYPALYKPLHLRASVGDVAVTFTPSGDGQFTGTVKLPTKKAATSMVVSASADARSARSGLNLGPISTVVRMATALPPSYPSLTPTQMDLPAVTGVGGTTGSLIVKGSSRGPTRACLAGNNLTGPEGIGTLAVKASKQCVEIPTNGQTAWQFSIRPSAAADGRVSGNLRVALTAARNAGTVEVAVPVGFSMSRPVDNGLRWALILALMAASLLIPLVFLWLANAWIGRYPLSPLTQAASVPVWFKRTGLTRRVNGSLMTRVAPGTHLIDPDDFRSIGTGTKTNAAAFEAQGLRFERSLPWWPLKAPKAVTSGAGSEILLTSTGEYRKPGSPSAPGSFGLASAWVLLIDPTSVTSEEAAGRLVFVNGDMALRDIIAIRTEQFANFVGWELLWDRVVELTGQPVDAADEIFTLDPKPPITRGDRPDSPDGPPPPTLPEAGPDLSPSIAGGGWDKARPDYPGRSPEYHDGPPPPNY